MFAIGDRVEWDDAGLVGCVDGVFEHSIAVKFVIGGSTHMFSFEPDGKIWRHAKRTSLKKIATSPNPRFAFMANRGRAYLYDSIEEASKAGHGVFFKAWLAYENLEDELEHGTVA